MRPSMRVIEGVRYYPGPRREAKARRWPPKDRHRRAQVRQQKRALVARLMEAL